MPGLTPTCGPAGSSRRVARQQPVDPRETEGGRVEPLARPDPPLVVLRIVGIAERHQEVGIAVRTADVLGRTGSATSQTQWQRVHDRLHRQAVLDQDHVLPAISEVVLVDARRTDPWRDLVELDRRVSIGDGSNSRSGSPNRTSPTLNS